MIEINKILEISKITDSPRETDILNMMQPYPVNSKIEPQVTQKNSTERWIESQTDCAD